MTPDKIKTPRQHFGFDLGEDRKLADWPDILEYFRVLDGSADRVSVESIGKSTEGNPFIVATISSPDNLARLDRFKEIQTRLADPRTVATDAEAEALIAEAKAVVMVTCSIHATEVGATQMCSKLAFDLASSDDPEVHDILENVILLLVPSVNPDGLIKVKQWYDGTLGTSHEGIFPPFLYHKYTGHDNNRDWFMFTQAETRLIVDRCLNTWHPQILYDLHQTRSTGMRMILPPFIDPVGPNVDPIIQSQLAAIGTSMASELTSQGKSGVAVNVVYDAYSPSRAYQHYHGGIRVLSEVAGVRIASPVHIEKSQLKPSRGENPSRQSWNHPMPWRGGRWGLNDIVDYERAAVMACLKNAAHNRDSWVRKFHRVGQNAVGSTRNSYAYLVPSYQRDENTATEMLRVLETARVEIHEATEPFVADGQNHPAGTKVIYTRQPYGAFAKTMLEVQSYPDLRQYPGGPPTVPYDVTAHSLPIQMGVDVIEIKSPFNTPTSVITKVEPPPGRVMTRANKPSAYLLRPDSNASARAINSLLNDRVNVHWTREPARVDRVDYPPGTFIIQCDDRSGKLVSEIAERDSLVFDACSEVPDVAKFQLRTPRIGIYQSYVATAEEGWTRFVFDEYGFGYETVTDSQVRSGGLEHKFDAIVLPHQAVRHLNTGQNSAYYPTQYAGGIGESGANSLRAFAERGGTLVAWDGAARYLVQHLGLKLNNSLAGLTTSEFYAPGSLLRVLLDTNHPIAYGMPDPTSVMFVNGPAFDVHEGRVVGKFPLHSPLQSGWLIGPEKIFGKAAVVSVPFGKGQVILIAFRVHFRAQARGTYKILFNSMFYSAAT